jgi:hypothetical protein
VPSTVAPALDRPAGRRRSAVASLARVRRAPLLALGAVMAAAAALYAGLTSLVLGPHIFGDELFYSGAANSLAEGHGLHIRGEHYGYGPVYPAVLALVRLTVSDQASAHWRWMIANGLFVALTAIPAYLIARRLLSPWWSVLIGALAVSVPSAFYAAAVMTDCLGYLVAVTCLLAIVLAVERPTVRRQLAVVAAVAVASGVRAQFASLFVSYLVALAVRWALARSPRPPVRASLRRLWPTVAVTVAGVLGVVALVAAGRSPSSLLGSYDVLAKGYPIIATLRWTVWHVFDLALYFGLFAFVAVPFGAASLYRRARAGSRPDAAMFSTFVGASVIGIVLVGAFSTSKFGLGRLHDRYLFYLVPLWLTVVAVWITRGAQRSRPAAIVVAVAFIAFVFAMPYANLIVPDGARMFDGTGTAVWARLEEFAGATHGLSGRRGLAGGTVLAAAWIVFVPRRYAWTSLAIAGVFFITGGAIMWDRTIKDTDKGVFSNHSLAARSWVDDAVPSSADVTLLTDGSPQCSSTVDRYAFLMTEFYNDRIQRVPYVGSPLDYGPPTHRLHVSADGTLRAPNGTPLAARYIVAPRGVQIAGRKLAVGTNARLVLWKTNGSVRFEGVTSDARFVREACT